MDKYITILDYCTGTILQRRLSESEQIDDDWFRSFDLKESQCSYMITETKPEPMYLYKSRKETL